MTEGIISGVGLLVLLVWGLWLAVRWRLSSWEVPALYPEEPKVTPSQRLTEALKTDCPKRSHEWGWDGDRYHCLRCKALVDPCEFL